MTVSINIWVPVRFCVLFVDLSDKTFSDSRISRFIRFTNWKLLFVLCFQNVSCFAKGFQVHLPIKYKQHKMLEPLPLSNVTVAW